MWRREVSFPEKQLLYVLIYCLCDTGQEYTWYKAHNGTHTPVAWREPLQEAMEKAVHKRDTNDPSEILAASQAVNY